MVNKKASPAEDNSEFKEGRFSNKSTWEKKATEIAVVVEYVV